MLKKGVHPKAIFHDLYVKTKSGGYSQIDLVVATPQGLVLIEILSKKMIHLSKRSIIFVIFAY